MNKKQRGFVIILVLLIAGLFIFWSESPKMKDIDQKVIIIGMDAIDPDLLEKWMDEGKLQNFNKLREMGMFSKLGTTNPAESPVAWSSFATGTNPGKHNIYDFLRRDPKTYMPKMAVVDSTEAEFIFNLIPIKPPEVRKNRMGDPFWNITSESGIRTTVIQAPVTFPPDEVKGGKLLSGLGVPDIRGTMGTFTYYATDAVEKSDTELGGKVLPIELKGNKVETIIYGPKNPFAEKYESITIPLEFEVENNSVKIKLQNQEQTLKENEWSDWFVIRFPITPIVHVYGISRFYVIQIKPELKIYLAPINIDPRNPVLPISFPSHYSRELTKEVGLYKTLGWAIDTWALNERVIDEDTFMEDLFFTVDKREEITFNELEKGDWNLFVSVFQSPDRVQHLFWRYLDKRHPIYNESETKMYGDAIFRVYKRMDEILGKILKYVDENTTLIVLSDHGFNSYRKGVNINRWFVENGFMALKHQEGKEFKLLDLYSQGLFWPNVDWSRTKAYNIGLGQIYINLKGRESQGFVTEEEYDKVRDEIIQKLLQLKDPETNESIIRRVYKKEEIYNGPYFEEAPDLVIGFNDGYRISWQSTLGGITEKIISNNMKKWSGDHCSLDPEITKGVLLINKKIKVENPNIMDIAPTVLKIFNITIPREMDGKPLV
jgi:predicted AlkP superfamily phosphohydrolase/phosphomutase